MVRVGNNRPDLGVNPICNRFTGVIEEGRPLFLPCNPPMPGNFLFYIFFSNSDFHSKLIFFQEPLFPFILKAHQESLCQFARHLSTLIKLCQLVSFKDLKIKIYLLHFLFTQDLKQWASLQCLHKSHSNTTQWD